MWNSIIAVSTAPRSARVDVINPDRKDPPPVAEPKDAP
jgi:hypothetical protein